MKKIIISIVVSILYFSIANSVSAQSIDEILELPIGPEIYQIQLDSKLDRIVFTDSSRQETYQDFVRVNEILRKELIRKYINGDFETYQMNGIVENYKKTVYYTNQVFRYLKMREDGMSGDEIETAIANGYSNIRVYYTRMKNIIKKNY